MRRRDTRRTQLQFEGLETRETMTTGITAVLADEVLRVTGTAAADQVAVGTNQGMVTVVDSSNGTVINRFSVAGIKQVVVDGGAGNDTIHYNTDIPASLIGGAGDDRLLHHGQAAVRSTLLIVVHGFWPTRDYGWREWNAYATQIRDQLEGASSDTVTWNIDWESLKSADHPEAELERQIRAFLDRQSETWDVLLFSHSRGAVLTANLVNHLDSHVRLGNVHAILLDPTASNLQGDVLPTKITGNAAVSQYDDRYVLAPTVVDGQRIRGAEYQDVRTEMRHYVRDHQGNAKWLDAHSKVASAVEKAIDWTGTFSEYLPEFSAVSTVLSGVVAAKDAIMNHVIMTDWYLQSADWDGDLRDFLAAKPLDDQYDVNGKLALERIRLEAGSAKVSVGGMIEAFVNTWRWPTDLALSAVQNMVDGAGQIIQGTVAGWFPRGSSERANLQTLGGQILGFSDHWFTLARNLTSDLHGPMSQFIIRELGPLVEKLADRGQLSTQSGQIKALARQLTGLEMVGHHLASVLKNLPVTKLIQALPHVSGGALRGYLANLSPNQLVSMAQKLDASDIQRMLNALSGSDGLAMLRRLSVSDIAEVVLKYDWSGRLKWLNALPVEQAANVILKFDGNTLLTALNKMDINRAADVVLEFNWDQRLSALNRMNVNRVADIIWKFDWSTMLKTLDRMGAGRVADVIWEYDWERMMNTLNRMSVSRVADVIWEYDWDRMMRTLSRMSVSRVADVIWEYDWNRMVDTLNHMSVSWAAKVVKQYSTSRMWDTLNHMSGSHKTEILRYLGLAPNGVSVSAGPVKATVSTSGSSISVGGRSFSV